MKRNIFVFLLFFLVLDVCFAYEIYKDNPPGIEIGEFQNIKIYRDPNVSALSVTYDLRFQCVEYVKRYYYKKNNYLLPLIKSNYAKTILDEWEGQNGLIKYKNKISTSLPCVGDIIVFNETPSNIAGHVAIISEINKNSKTIRFAQQNFPGEAFGETTYEIKDNKTYIRNYYQQEIIGWLSCKTIKLHILDIVPKNKSQITTVQRIMIKFSNDLSSECIQNIKDYVSVECDGNNSNKVRIGIVNKNIVVIGPEKEWDVEKITITVSSNLHDESNQQLSENIILNYKVKTSHLVSTGPECVSNYVQVDFPTVPYHPDSGIKVDAKGQLWFFANRILFCIDQNGKQVRAQTKILDLNLKQGHLFNFRGKFIYILVRAYKDNKLDYYCIVYTKSLSKNHKIIRFDNDLWQKQWVNVYHIVRSEIDKNGNLFFIDDASPVQHIRKISPNGRILKIISNLDFENVFDFTAIATDNLNNIYVMARVRYKGARGYRDDKNTILVFDNDLNLIKSKDMDTCYTGMYIDRKNNLYLTNSNDVGYWEKYTIEPDDIEFVCRYKCQGGAHIITVDSLGNVYVSNGAKIYKYIPKN